MRTVFLFFILFYFSLAAFSQDKKTLFVHAENGLIMRKEPATTGEKLLTLPYGSKIQLLSEEKFGKLTEVKELSNWNISGQWLYVTFNGQDGYVFEGFVSWLPASQNKTNERFEKYFLEEIGVISGKYDFKKTKITEEFKVETVCGFSQNLNFGITYSENDCNEAGRTVKILLKKNISLAEAYLILKKIFYSGGKYSVKFSEKEHELNFTYDGDEEGCDTSIRKTVNGIEIFVVCSK